MNRYQRLLDVAARDYLLIRARLMDYKDALKDDDLPIRLCIDADEVEIFWEVFSLQETAKSESSICGEVMMTPDTDVTEAANHLLHQCLQRIVDNKDH